MAKPLGALQRTKGTLVTAKRLRHLGRTASPHCRGYILPFVLVLLVALMAGSMSFFNRANDNTQLSGASRDYDQAMLLAESGGDWVAGRFLNSSTSTYVSTVCAAAAKPGDLNCDATLDMNQGKPISVTPTLPLPLGYEYYMVTAGTTIRVTTTPGMLQIIADGEARNAGTALANQTVLEATTRLLVNDLFVSNTIHPILLVQGSQGCTATNTCGLVRSTNTWNAETSSEKVAVWLEITRGIASATAYDLYLCSVAKVGNAKAYLQRYIGTYGDPVLGNITLSPLSESANHP